MENNPNNQRIKVKIGDAEFEAEGLPEIVQQQFASFLQVMSAQPKKPAEEKKDVSGADPNSRVGIVGIGGVGTELERVFRRGDVLSLIALPKGNNAAADAALILLYGYDKLLNTSAVTGVAIMKSMQQSGVRVDRVDRTLDAHTDFVNAAGYKRGRRYSLNNRGITEAERLIQEMVK